MVLGFHLFAASEAGKKEMGDARLPKSGVPKGSTLKMGCQRRDLHRYLGLRTTERYLAPITNLPICAKYATPPVCTGATVPA
jgi:hypothetical protein